MIKLDLQICCITSSSYYAYIYGNEPYWLCTNQTLNYFGENKQRAKYKVFTEEGVDKEINDFFTKVRKISILETQTFIKTVTEKYLQEQHKIRDIPEHKALVRSQVCPISKSYERFKTNLVSDEKLTIEINELVSRINGYMSIVET